MASGLTSHLPWREEEILNFGELRCESLSLETKNGRRVLRDARELIKSYCWR